MEKNELLEEYIEQKNHLMMMELFLSSSDYDLTNSEILNLKQEIELQKRIVEEVKRELNRNLDT